MRETNMSIIPQLKNETLSHSFFMYRLLPALKQKYKLIFIY